jgi:hypothetical protein
MAQQNGFIGGPVFRLFKQRFELSRRSVQQIGLDAPGL